MPTVKIKLPEAGATHRCLQAIAALFPGVTPEAVLEALVEDSFEQALEDFGLLQSYGEGGVEYMEEMASRAAQAA